MKLHRYNLKEIKKLRYTLKQDGKIIELDLDKRIEVRDLYNPPYPPPEFIGHTHRLLNELKAIQESNQVEIEIEFQENNFEFLQELFNDNIKSKEA